MRRGRDAERAARAEEAIAQIAALSVRLHATLVKAGSARADRRTGEPVRCRE